MGTCGYRKTNWEIIAIIQLRNNGDLYQDCGDGSGEKQSESRYILKMEPKK